ncbi:MAG: hypothetical protein ABT04_00805 [Granulicella sp. SCN 62-9]|nr:MAG: hypothetical protein ABT04_00805 [Granulicella sp. SCN 62-9]
MTRVHGLKHVQRFTAAALSHDDSIWAHAQAVTHEVPDCDGALALGVARACFERHEIDLIESQLGSIFDGDDTFVVRNMVRENVEQGRLARPSTS